MMEIGPVATYCYMGYCKSPEPFIFFSHVIVFFPSYRFSKRWLHTLTKGFTWARKGKRKRKSKGREKKEQERDRKGTGKGEEREKQGRVSHRPFLMPKVIVFVFVLLSFVNPVHVPFFWKWLQSSKKDCSDHLPGTFLVQRIWHAFVGAPLRQQTMKWRNQKH